MAFLKSLASKLYAYAIKYPIAVAATVLLVSAAIFIAISGRKFQIGGILGRLWGSTPDVTPDLRLVPPSDRKDEQGNQILPGQSDEHGFVQSPTQVEIEAPGIFSNPDIVTVVHPKRGRETIVLPTGVKNSDVKQIVEISPKVYEIRNDDKGVDAASILDEIGGKK